MPAEITSTFLGFLPGMLNLLLGIALLGIIGGGIFAITKFNLLKGFPIKVEIYELRNENLLLRHARARRVSNKTGENFYQFKGASKLNELVKPQAFKHIVIDAKGNSNLMLFSPEAGSYFPLVFDINDKETKGDIKKLKVLNADIVYWKGVSDKQANLLWSEKGLMEKIWPIIVIMMLALGFVLILYATMKYGVQPALETAQQLTSQMAESSANLREYCAGVLNAGSNSVVSTPATPP